jgi:hypothetical protein
MKLPWRKNRSGKSPERGANKVAENDQQQQPPTSSATGDAQPAATTAGQQDATFNVVSEHTGQFDVRFLLWRTFCAETGVAVDTLPSELKGELRDRWDKMKDNELHQPTEANPTPPVSNT